MTSKQQLQVIDLEVADLDKKSKKPRFSTTAQVIVGTALALIVGYAYAQSSGSASPIEAPLCDLVNTINGRVILIIAAIALAAGGVQYLFSHRLGETFQFLVSVILVVAMILGGVAIIIQVAKVMGKTPPSCLTS